MTERIGIQSGSSNEIETVAKKVKKYIHVRKIIELLKNN